MNFIDILLIILLVIVLIGGLVLTILAFIDEAYDVSVYIVCGQLICILIISSAFVVLDRGSGSTIGEITSVDKNFFGTTAIFIKTSENDQEEYCIENEKVVERAKEMIGKRVKVSYGERVGLYSTSKCNQAPIDKIEIIKEEDK